MTLADQASAGASDGCVIVAAMSGDEPTIEELRRQQLESERAERQALADAQTGADAETHRRRADKASYLRHKLDKQRQADLEGDADVSG